MLRFSYEPMRRHSPRAETRQARPGKAVRIKEPPLAPRHDMGKPQRGSRPSRQDVNAQVKRASLECARDQINDDGVPWAPYRQVDNRRDPPAPGEWRPVVSADQAAAPLQVEAGLGLQRHDGVRGSAA